MEKVTHKGFPGMSFTLEDLKRLPDEVQGALLGTVLVKILTELEGSVPAQLSFLRQAIPMGLKILEDAGKECSLKIIALPKSALKGVELAQVPVPPMPDFGKN